MTVRVVHAHPVPESYSAAVLDAVVAGLRARSEPVVHRLGDGSEPGPTVDELGATRELWFVHPTWWGGQPAVLLDWIQTTLGPWIDGGSSTPPPLADVGRLGAVTTHGSSAFVNRLQGEPGRQLLTRVLAPLCAPRTRPEWVAFYGMDRSDDTGRQAFLDRAHDAVLAGPVRA